MTKWNCKSCQEDKHGLCQSPDGSDGCLCAEDNHLFVCNECKKDGVFSKTHAVCEKLYFENKGESSCQCKNIGHHRNQNPDLDKESDVDTNDWIVCDECTQGEYNQFREDKTRLWNLLNKETISGDPTFTLVEIVTLLVVVEHMVSKFDIPKKLESFHKKHNFNGDFIDDAVEIVWNDEEKFEWIKKISFGLGSRNVKTRFDKTQIIEAGEWIKGNNFIKRVEVTGGLLFYNGKFYDSNGEAYVRREARKALDKPKTKEVTEVFQYINDTCELISRRDIESALHIKCLANGLYDVSSGVFSSKFTPDYIILNQIPHNFDESAKYDRIDEVVESIIPDKRSRQSFYDFLSTCFHPFTGVDYQMGLVGVSGTGKSQLGLLAQYVVGDGNYTTTKIHDLANDQTLQLDAADKMLNYDDDLNDQSIKQIDVIKKWVTQSSITIRKIYHVGETLSPTSRFLFAANDLYEIPNTDDAEAIYDRTYLIRIDKKYRHKDIEVKNVMKKVTDKKLGGQGLDGFVTYLLKNATWIADNEKYHYPISPRTVSEIWNIFGNRISEFKKEWIVNSPSYRLDSNDPFNKWSEFCNDNGYKPKSKKLFKETFDELVGNIPTKTRKKINDTEEKIEIYAYTGIRIKTQEEFDNDKQTELETKPDDKANGFLGSVVAILSNTMHTYHTNNTVGDKS